MLDVLATVPKAELHCHCDGSLPVPFAISKSSSAESASTASGSKSTSARLAEFISSSVRPATFASVSSRRSINCRSAKHSPQAFRSASTPTIRARSVARSHRKSPRSPPRSVGRAAISIRSTTTRCAPRFARACPARASRRGSRRRAFATPRRAGGARR